MIDLFARIIGYVVIGTGAIAAWIYIFWWLVGKIIKMLGYWPLFVKTLYRIGYEKNKKMKGGEK